MIAPSVVDRIQQLLSEGRWTWAQIAQTTAVSRSSVAAIARGKRSVAPRTGGPRDEEPELAAGPPVRCRTCGGITHMPCRVCQVRELMAGSRLPARPGTGEEPLKLELREHHRKRYEETRRRRIRQERCRDERLEDVE